MSRLAGYTIVLVFTKLEFWRQICPEGHDGTIYVRNQDDARTAP